MFWYLHPLKTCKLVPISLKDVRLGANQVPHSLYPNHRVESESKTYLYHGTTQTFARVRGLFQITDQVGSGKESMAPKRSHSAGVGREASASRGRRASRGGEGAASRGGEGAVVPRSAQLVARNNGINCRAPVVVQETAARTAAATGRMTGLPDVARSTGKGRRSRYACRGTLCALVHRAGVPSDERLFCTAGQWI